MKFIKCLNYFKDSTIYIAADKIIEFYDDKEVGDVKINYLCGDYDTLAVHEAYYEGTVEQLLEELN